MGLREMLQKRKAEISEKNKQAGAEFLEKNKQRKEVVTTPTGLQYEILQKGEGKKPSVSDKVTCHYEGKLLSGKLFDSSVRRGQPATFALTRVIAGWTEGLQYMNEGSKYRFFIPDELAYGQNQVGSIPPCSTLIFDVELIKVE